MSFNDEMNERDKGGSKITLNLVPAVRALVRTDWWRKQFNRVKRAVTTRRRNNDKRQDTDD